MINNLETCIECGAKISPEARHCPQCGAFQLYFTIYNRFVIFIISSFIFMGLYNEVSGFTKDVPVILTVGLGVSYFLDNFIKKIRK